MRKIILMIIICISSLVSQESIYPLPIIFNDNGFISNGILFYKDVNFTEFIIKDSKDNAIFYHNKIWPFHCDEVKTYNDFLHVDKNKKCFKALNAFKPKHTETINKDMIKILVYEVKPSGLFAYIFHNDKFIAKLGYNGKNSKEFYDILKSIKINKNIKPLEFYIKKGLESLKFLKLNSAYKYIYSALLIDPKNDKIKPLIKQLEKLQKLKFGMLKNTAGMKENDESECEDKNNTK